MAKRGGKRPGAGRKVGESTLVAQRVREYIAKQLEKNLAPIVKTAMDQAKRGDKAAREWLSDQSMGKPTQPVSGPDGKDLFPNDLDRAAAAKALEAL